MDDLAPRLAGLVRRGVGLNTRAGAGRFITQARAAGACSRRRLPCPVDCCLLLAMPSDAAWRARRAHRTQRRASPDTDPRAALSRAVLPAAVLAFCSLSCVPHTSFLGSLACLLQVTRRLGSSMQPLASQLIKASQLLAGPAPCLRLPLSCMSTPHMLCCAPVSAPHSALVLFLPDICRLLPALQALAEACRADRSAAVRRSYAAAAALLCRYAPRARVDRFVADALASLAGEGADRDDRYVAGGRLVNRPAAGCWKLGGGQAWACL